MTVLLSLLQLCLKIRSGCRKAYRVGYHIILIIMKKKSLKVKVQELAKTEMRQTKGGYGSSDQSAGKTVTQTGKKKNADLMSF